MREGCTEPYGKVIKSNVAQHKLWPINKPVGQTKNNKTAKSIQASMSSYNYNRRAEVFDSEVSEAIGSSNDV
jgi:hypothetical protein